MLMKKRFNVYLDDELWLSFRKKCLEKRRSASALLTEVLTQFLKKPKERKPRD